jgi:uncharacterized protein YecE (DUF72 family)
LVVGVDTSPHYAGEAGFYKHYFACLCTTESLDATTGSKPFAISIANCRFEQTRELSAWEISSKVNDNALINGNCRDLQIGNWQSEIGYVKDGALMRNLYVGTSGYSYKEWKGSFYPEKLAAKDMLSYYANRLKAVELNNTFYRLPQRGMVESWKAQVPDDFRFSVKASQRITHFKRLKEAEDATNYLLDTVSALEDRLGVVLFQLPPNMKKDLERLESFLKVLPADLKATFEFRHPTWFDDDVLELLRHQNRALCVSDTDDLPIDHIDKTSDWGYLRLRRVNYSASDLDKWLKRIEAQNWQATFVFFKHEDEGTGPKLAAEFIAQAARSCLT